MGEVGADCQPSFNAGGKRVLEEKHQLFFPQALLFFLASVWDSAVLHEFSHTSNFDHSWLKDQQPIRAQIHHREHGLENDDLGDFIRNDATIRNPNENSKNKKYNIN